MEYQQLAALASFAFASTASPGPNNIMLMTSGANVGFLRTIPHMLGIVLGFSLMVTLIGLGIAELFASYPLLLQGLQVGCVIYLIYLAINIALSRPSDGPALSFKPMSFWAAASFQWINPKAWSMALAAVNIHNSAASWQGVVMIALVFAAVNVPSVTLWTLAGQQSKALLSDHSRKVGFNLIMAALLLASILPTILP
ncbi:LysE family translocator [Motiliproteus sediminis]|uniref:LysE family translocator n=1 Tax=Motiliproteus sediminis TaxID=1468178 RepID=UPI001AEF889B|nr:LysE family translocator [Motiliproteus sediminis]